MIRQTFLICLGLGGPWNQDRNNDLLIPDIGGVLAFPELVRLPLVYHHNNGLIRRYPLILELERKEVSELPRPGRLTVEEHYIV